MDLHNSNYGLPYINLWIPTILIMGIHELIYGTLYLIDPIPLLVGIDWLLTLYLQSNMMTVQSQVMSSVVIGHFKIIMHTLGFQSNVIYFVFSEQMYINVFDNYDDVNLPPNLTRHCNYESS